MKRRTTFILAGTMALAAVGGSAAAVAANSGGDDESTPAITGPDLEHATRVALAKTGGGKVTGSEVGDEEGAYEVEVTKDDGSQVDVHLDRDFNVLDAKADDGGEQGGEHEGGN